MTETPYGQIPGDAPVCPNCAKTLDGYTAVGQAAEDHRPMPHDGAVSICYYCGAISIFTGGGTTLRPCTKDELRDLMADEDIRKISWATAMAREQSRQERGERI